MPARELTGLMDTDDFKKKAERLREQIHASQKEEQDEFDTYHARPVEQAQAAWDAGFLYVHVRLSDLWVFAKLAGTGDSYDREIHWTSSVAEIVAMGWRLHTWAVVLEKDNRLAAAPVFERVQVPAG